MKSKVEKILDREFEVLKIKPRVYHFPGEMVKQFGGITVVDEKGLSWKGIRNIIDTIYFNNDIALLKHSPASRMRRLLKERGLLGIAICDKRDTYNRRRGREIAKGRLWVHLTGRRLKLKNGKFEVVTTEK